MKTFFSAALIVFVAVLLAPAQSKPAGSGHWEGAIQLPDRELKILVDLAQNDKGEWIGNIGIPEQGLKEFPLSKIAVKGTSVSFAMNGIPGEPAFQGDLSPSGKAIKGSFTQGGATLTFELKWVSEPNVKLAAKSTPITKEFEGTWEGALAVPDGTKLRLRVKLANGADGTAAGTLNSLDQGAVEMPLSTITQKGSAITLELKLVGGTFTGDLKGDELVGTWAQGMGSLPLTFKRGAKD
ncbi:MAG: hypothetical protein ABSE56_02370 [Bryobacteraceae bacterium]|jgi:hypothetical protein